MSTLQQKTKEFDSFLLAALYVFLHKYIDVTMGRVYYLFGLRKEHITLRHADVFLLSTTLTILGLICASQIWMPLGWVRIVLGNVRIIQIVFLNLNTLMFDFTPISESAAAVKRARWHFLALGFSFLDIILCFGFMYQFFDHYFKIMNQHSTNFIDYLYFAVVTIATLGYGDFIPVTVFGRIVAIYQLFVALFFMAFVVAGAMGRFQKHA